jgi:hypothetical protein
MQSKTAIIFCLLATLASCSSKHSLTAEQLEAYNKEMDGFKKIAEANAENYTTMHYFPADTAAGGGFYSVQITSTSGMFFTDDFRQHLLYGNGYCWADIIKQLLERKNSSLLQRIQFDPEGDVCFIKCPDEETMLALAGFIHDTCDTREKMQQVLKDTNKLFLDC